MIAIQSVNNWFHNYINTYRTNSTFYLIYVYNNKTYISIFIHKGANFCSLEPNVYQDAFPGQYVNISYDPLDQDKMDVSLSHKAIYCIFHGDGNSLDASLPKRNFKSHRFSKKGYRSLAIYDLFAIWANMGTLLIFNQFFYKCLFLFV